MSIGCSDLTIFCYISVLGSRNLKLNNLLNYTLREGAPGVDMLATAVEDLLGP
jgi:hypothetical protein